MSRLANNIPLPVKPPRKRFISLPALGFIFASLMLAGVLAIMSWHNLDREKNFMEGFLFKQAETLIRAFEAGARTSMMMGPAEGNLTTLVTETAREETVAYILIRNDKGKTVAGAGSFPDAAELPPAKQVLAGEQPQVRFLTDDAGQRIYEIAKEFNPLTKMPRQKRMMARWQRWCNMTGDASSGNSRQIIYLGLYTRDFDAARAADVEHSLVMLGILFLLSSGGFYALFLAHTSRVTRAALENMELYTDNVVNSMPAGLISVDSAGRIVTVNSLALEILACSTNDILGHSLKALLSPNESVLAASLHEGREFIDHPLDYQRQDGEIVPLKVSASQLRDREGNLAGMVLILRDQREIRKMEEALERSRRHAALGRMAAGIAHEIRNPLGTLKGFSQYFARNAKGDEQAKEYAELMVGEVDRLNRTVSALLQFSRPRDPELQPVDLRFLAQKALTFVQEEADNKQVELTLELPDAAIALSADPDLLQQVLLNLLQNSLAATAGGGHITLGGRAEAGEVQLWVRDSGKGISDEEQKRIFDPFYTTRKDGTGLGLPVVQQIVEQHRGRIEIDSRPQEGTNITIILPQRGQA